MPRCPSGDNGDLGVRAHPRILSRLCTARRAGSRPAEISRTLPRPKERDAGRPAPPRPFPPAHAHPARRWRFGALWRHRRARRLVVRHRSGPDRRTDRPQRRGQDHAVQLPFAGSTAFQRRRSLSTATPCSPCRRHGIAGLGIGRTFQNLALFRDLSCSTILWLARHCRTRSGFWPMRCACLGSARGRARCGRARSELMRFLGLERGRRSAGGRDAVRHAEARRTRARAGQRAEAAAARRTRRRAQP